MSCPGTRQVFTQGQWFSFDLAANRSPTPRRARADERIMRLSRREEHILRCLGAAVIMEWKDLPPGIQRELFDHAISMGELNHTAKLKGRIAKFLDKHKDGAAGCRLE